jgi:hypothetical protein
MIPETISRVCGAIAPEGSSSQVLLSGQNCSGLLSGQNCSVRPEIEWRGVRRVMLHTRWSAEAWSVVRMGSTPGLAPPALNRAQCMRAPRTRLHPSSRHDARAARDESVEVPRARAGRASDRRDQTRLRLHQGVLPRLGQEPASTRGRLRAGESVHDAEALAPPPGGVICRSTEGDALKTTSEGAHGLPAGLVVAVHDSLPLRWSRLT